MKTFIASVFVFSAFISVALGCSAGQYVTADLTCQPCPVNTYRDSPGYFTSCISCPSFSGHSLTGSTTVNDCKCLTGYNGSPEHGWACTIRRCEQPYPPPNAAIVGYCYNTYLSVCRMKCNEGYEPSGSEERQCVVSSNNVMHYSGFPLSCSVIRCPFLVVPYANPPTGVCTSPSVEYNTRCTFSCLYGYQLKGSVERVCQQDKSWSGHTTTCEQIFCPALPPVQTGVTLMPSYCVTGPFTVHLWCQYTCPLTYYFEENSSISSSYVGCLPNGTWSGSIGTCHDFESPKLKCPDSALYANTSQGMATANVTWSVQVSDNSLTVDPNAVIQLRSSHHGHEYPIGQTAVQVNATDEAGNVASCEFSVVVQDNEPPSCSFCPADIVLESTNSWESVSTDQPLCSDNSGNPPSIRSNQQSRYSVPGSYHIQYTVSDGVNEYTGCSFTITLRAKTCPILTPPLNGALACTSTEIAFCAALCQNGTDFEFNPPLLYYCYKGQFQFFALPGQPYEQKIPGPNCSGSASPSWIKIFNRLPWYYYSGDANDINVQDVIKSRFLQLMSSGYVPPYFCADCTKDGISVSPGVIG